MKPPLALIERLARLDQEFQIAHIAVAQGMVPTKPLRKGSLQRRVNLRTDLRVIDMLERL